MTRSLQKNLFKITVIALSLVYQAVFADSASPISVPCHGAMIDPVSSVNWDGIYPITIGSSDVVQGDLPDTPNPGSTFCECGSPIPEFGAAIGYWEPMALVDVTRTPYCLVNLGGTQAQSNDNRSFALSL